MQRAMAHRVEDEIRELCKELLAGKDDDQQIQNWSNCVPHCACTSNACVPA